MMFPTKEEYKQIKEIYAEMARLRHLEVEVETAKRECPQKENCSEYREDEHSLCLRDYKNCIHFKFLKKQLGEL